MTRSFSLGGFFFLFLFYCGVSYGDISDHKVGKKWKGKTATEWIKGMDTKLQGKSSISLMEMKIVTPRWRRSLRMKAWIKGLDYAFVRILSPQRERGTASLKRKMQMWNYLPRAEMVIKVPPSMMMGSWMGSDFTNDDLLRGSNVSRDYVATFLPMQKGKKHLLRIQLIPRPNAPVVWGKIIVSLRNKDQLPVREEFFNEKGKLIRVMQFDQIKKMDDRFVPTRMKVWRVAKPGFYTIFRYLTIRFNKRISRRTFTLRNLKSKNW